MPDILPTLLHGKNLLIIALLFFTASVCLGQDEAQVMEPVNQLFEGMRRGQCHGAPGFHHSARMTSVKTDGTITDDALADFLKAIGTPHTEVWNEVIWKPVVQVDGTFAGGFGRLMHFMWASASVTAASMHFNW